MKKINNLIGTVFTLLIFIAISCNTTDNPSPDNGSGLDDIIIPGGFTFETTEELQIHIKVIGLDNTYLKRAKIFIYSGYPDSTGVQIASGGIDQNGDYITTISKAKILDSLFISSNITGLSLGMTAISGNEFNHTFNFTQRSAESLSRQNTDFTDIISDFENGLDGWLPYRDNSILTSGADNTPINGGPMGPSDSFIWGFDTRGGLRSYLAPDKFTGNLYGQYIAYHYYLGNTVKARPVSKNIADIRITDGTKVLAIDLSSAFNHVVNAGWQTIYCKLDETETSGSGWRIGNMSAWTTGNGGKSTPKTPATDEEIKQILENVTGILLAPEYQNGYYSSNGPEFIALGKVGVVSDVASFPIIQQGEQPMPDADNDGVPDSSDDYPNDPNKAYNNFGPGENSYGTLAFEDLWPMKGDYDFNDVVIDYNYNVITNATNKVVEIEGKYIIKASGAGFLNGFAVEFPVNHSTVLSVSGQELSGNTFTLNGNGTEAGQTNAVIALFDDTHTLFDVSGFINTDPSLEYHEPVEMDIVIQFNGNFGISDLGSAPYNPFIISNQRRGYEIHLAGKSNTELADTGLFGTDNDDTKPSQSKYYQTKNNLPWAIHLPVNFEYPVESVSIENAYLKFVEWAESGGNQYQDWYLDGSGYRNNDNIYQIPD